MVRIAIGGIYHETNTFVAGTTSLADFRAYQFAVKAEMLAYKGTRSEIGGFLDGCEARNWEPILSIFAAAVPSGPVDNDAFEVIVDHLLDGLVAEQRPDGVLLCLHGAMATTKFADADGEVVRRMVEVLEQDVPIVATVDFHANVSDAMTDGVDALLGYDTYPHIDMYERGFEAVSILSDVLDRGARRTTVHHKVGLITAPQVQYTDLMPMSAIMDNVHTVESSDDVVISVMPGFPYANVDSMGMSVVASSADHACAIQVASAIAANINARSEEFSFAALSVDDAVDRALRATGPVVLVDSADNVGGGAPGDGTTILKQWMERGASGLIVALTDPGSVNIALAAGVGSKVHLAVGGHTDNRHGAPVELDGTVRLISDGIYVHRGSYATGLTTHMGRSAVIESNGNTIVVTEKRVMPFDAQQLLSLGVSPAHCQALVVKSAVAWRAAYGEFAREVIEVDTPGVCTANLHQLGLSEYNSRMIRPRNVEKSRRS